MVHGFDLRRLLVLIASMCLIGGCGCFNSKTDAVPDVPKPIDPNHCSTGVVHCGHCRAETFGSNSLKIIVPNETHRVTLYVGPSLSLHGQYQASGGQVVINGLALSPGSTVRVEADCLDCTLQVEEP